MHICFAACAVLCSTDEALGVWVASCEGLQQDEVGRCGQPLENPADLQLRRWYAGLHVGVALVVVYNGTECRVIAAACLLYTGLMLRRCSPSPQQPCPAVQSCGRYVHFGIAWTYCITCCVGAVCSPDSTRPLIGKGHPWFCQKGGPCLPCKASFLHCGVDAAWPSW